MRQPTLFAATLICLSLAISQAQPLPAADPPSAEASGPLDPPAALARFHLPDDLRIELAAAEPAVIDPVAIRFDERGRMWVAEMRDYPIGPTAEGKQHSRIRVLEDRDQDGQYETTTLFADNRSFVTGLQPWKGGVIITESGQVSYLKDENGDGRADRDETWFTGFSEGNTQLRANHPRLGIDNHIYIANGLRGGAVVDHRGQDQTPISINGMDFRFDPLGGSAQAVSGAGQFGMTIDDWGNRFICSNRNPVRHVVIEDRYLKANPRVTIPAVVHDVAAFGENSRVFPLSRAWTTSNLHAGQFTAACGVYLYRGTALPKEYTNNAFTCDPTGNLVHREILAPQGPTFTSQPAYADREWLASTDEWFRPVSLELGPDGALYVVDMYRAVIEHPEFMPEELKKRPDLRLGDDRGRIYRVTAKNNKQPKKNLTLADAQTPQLLSALGSHNAWERDTAQRLLLERGISGSAVGELLLNDTTAEAQARALFFQPSDEQLTHALQSPHNIVRRLAVQVAEPRTKESSEILNAVRSRLTDDDATVRFQVLLTLAEHQQHDLPSLARALRQSDFDDPWMRSAIELAAGDRSGDLLTLLLKRETGHRKGEQELLASLAFRTVTLGKAPAARKIFSDISQLSSDSDSDKRFACVLLEAVARAGRSQQLTLESLADSPGQKAYLTELVSHAERLAGDAGAEQDFRREAIALLGYSPSSVSDLLRIVRSEANQTLRQAAVTALANQPDIDPWRELLQEIAGITPGIRRSILEASIGPSPRAAMLLDVIEAGHLKAAELDLVQTNRLRQHRDAAIRDRAVKLLRTEAPTDRAAALQQYRSALTLTGDAVRGRTIFEKNCSTCHRVGDVGVNVAPDISDSRTKTAEQLLTDIVQPNRAIDNNYIAYNVLLADGTNTTGILTTESTTSITLKQPGDKTIVVSRDDIEELRSSGVSLMPEGLEKNIEVPAMADLLSYLKNWRYLDGKTPLGN